jgi:formylmethanofuran dehydrogenase subunit A
MQCIQQNEPQKLKAFIAWLLGATKGFAPKLVNPGGVEVWKSHQGGNVHGLDEKVDHFGVTPRQIIREVAHAAGELGLPHPVHIHCNNLGMPGNWETTLETMKALEGHRAHITHIQFHSYGGGEGDENTSHRSFIQIEMTRKQITHSTMGPDAPLNSNPRALNSMGSSYLDSRNSTKHTAAYAANGSPISAA